MVVNNNHHVAALQYGGGCAYSGTPTHRCALRLCTRIGQVMDKFEPILQPVYVAYCFIQEYRPDNHVTQRHSVHAVHDAASPEETLTACRTGPLQQSCPMHIQ
jgi:hypothetical protein